MILVIGSTGMLGKTLTSYLSSINVRYKTLDRIDVDFTMTDKDELRNLVLKSDIDVIVNCTGVIPHRNDSVYNMIVVNSLLPLMISDICSKNDKKMIHITSDAVFDGDSGNYTENSKPNNCEKYGMTKYLGEPEDCTTIRTSIIGEEVQNKKSLLEWLKSNSDGFVDGFKNHIWNGMTALQLSKIIYRIISENLFWNGTRHLYSDKISKYELLIIINEIYDLNININATTSEKNIDRSLSSLYDNNIFSIPGIRDQIIETRMFHSKN